MSVYRKKKSDYVVGAVIGFILVTLIVTTLYPFLNALAISLNDAKDTVRGGITIFPRMFTLDNYVRILKDPTVYNAYFITIARTVIGTITSVFFTGMFAYGLSKSELVGHRFYTIFCIVPMYVSGGLIPTFLLINSLKLTNSFWVYIIPGVISVWNMILMRTYFRGIPGALEESALIDGAGYFKIFFKIIVPLSTPIIATICLFNAVGHWNSWFDAALYVSDQELKPIQSVLMSIVNAAKATQAMSEQQQGAASEFLAQVTKVNERSLSMATMIITVLPIIMIYPFLQKYFVKGIMVGSLKG